MGGVFSGGGGGGGGNEKIAEMFKEGMEATKPPAQEAEPVPVTGAETKLAANTRARRRMGTRLLFSQERSAGLGTQQSKLGGASPGENTLA